MKKLYVNIASCTACNTCQLACAFSQYHDGFDPRKSRIHIHKTGNEKGIPILCLECEEAACVKVCPTQALYKNEELGIVDIDHEKCIHCKACIVACPFGNITIDDSKNRVGKCDLCHGHPMCAMFCPTGALQYK
jgi:Fe-S-cluster-containing dehydrogenase component